MREEAKNGKRRVLKVCPWVCLMKEDQGGGICLNLKVPLC